MTRLFPYNTIKSLLLGSPLEHYARSVATKLGSSKSSQYDRETIAVIKRVLRHDSNAVDIGCHRGAILWEILRRAPKGMHEAFEPIPGLCTYLRHVFPSVQVHNVALSHCAGEATFHHVKNRPGLSGFRRNESRTSADTVEVITVRTMRLDDILPANRPIDFIKIDVEGAEMEVLQGAIETIRRHRPVIVFEFGLGGADQYGTEPNTLYQLLVEQCGLRVSLMNRWLKGELALTQSAFVEHYENGLDFYFMAHPPSV